MHTETFRPRIPRRSHMNYRSALRPHLFILVSAACLYTLRPTLHNQYSSFLATTNRGLFHCIPTRRTNQELPTEACNLLQRTLQSVLWSRFSPSEYHASQESAKQEAPQPITISCHCFLLCSMKLTLFTTILCVNILPPLTPLPHRTTISCNCCRRAYTRPIIFQRQKRLIQPCC